MPDSKAYLDIIELYELLLANQSDISDYSDLYELAELILDYLLKDEPQSFSTIRAKIHFLYKEQILSDFNNYYLIQLVNAYYNHQKINPELLSLFQALIYSIIKKHIKPDLISNECDAIIKHYSALHTNTFNKLLNNLTLRICEVETLQTNIGNCLLKITGYDNKADNYTVFLWENSETSKIPFEKRISHYKDLLFTDSKVRFENLAYSEAKQAYLQTKDTLLIIMPDFLMDASALAECFNNVITPEIFFLKLFKSNDFTNAIFKGLAVNQILDNKLNQINESPEQSLDNLIKNNLLKILNLNDFNPQALLYDIKAKHLPNIEKLSATLKNLKVITEPSFISPEYGIQGRLDALLENEQNPLEKTIFELKAGSCPPEGVYSNNLFQVCCYELLMRSVWGKQRVGHSMIFYSASNNNPLRDVPIYKTSIEQLVMCRNLIVADIYKASLNNYTYLEKILSPNFKAQKFSEELISEIRQTFSQQNAYELEYFKAFVSFIIREFIHDKTGLEGDNWDYGFSALWQLDYEAKNKSALIFDNLSFINVSKKLLSFKTDPLYISLNFREGDPVLIYAKNNADLSPQKTFLLKGSFISYQNHLLIVSLRNEQLSQRLFQKDNLYVLEKDIMEVSNFSLLSSMYDFLKADKIKRAKLLGLVPPESDYQESDDKSTASDKIIQKALKAKDYFIIQGPPGTGKTSKIIMGLLRELLIKTNEPIILLAFTNRAIDEIMSRMNENDIHFLCMGNRKSDLENHINSILSDDFELSKHKLKNERIFISTVANFNNEGKALLDIIGSGTLIVDEASQLLEPHLAGLIVRFNKWILIGDHFQLPAVSSQNEVPAPDILKENVGLVRLNESLFERMIRLCQNNHWDYAWDILKEHYRMHSDIANLINHFYENKLIPGTERQNNKNLSNSSEILFGNRTLFIPTKLSLHSKTNEMEAEIVISILKKYLDNKTKLSFGIICNWKAQVNLIMNKILKEKIDLEIMVDTVERFQGSEKDVIIYSTALNSTKQLAMVSLTTHDNLVDRKLNVAISRAKSQFILIGNPDILNQSIHYQRLLNLLQHCNYLGTFL